MASTVTRSPPTSRAIDARSSVVATRFSLPCAVAFEATSEAATSAIAAMSVRRRLERMCTMSSDRILELKEQFIRRRPLGVGRAAVLAAHLAELARPVGHEE